MANHRNPNSPSEQGSAPRPGDVPPAGPLPATPTSSEDDGDISLDDYEERTQLRPRLPEQRRESAPQEMGARPVAPREHGSPALPGAVDPFESHAAPSAWVPSTPDEIDTYNPSAADVLLEEPTPRPAPKRSPESPAGRPVSHGIDELEEFIAKTVTDTPAADMAAKPKRPLSMLEILSFGAGGVILLVLGLWLVRAVTSEAGEGKPKSDGWPDVPMKGSLVTVKEAASNWRRRVESDRVAQMEVILPTPGLEMPEIIPQVTFTIDSGASSDGYLRFIFKDSEGKPRGDTRVVHVKGGKLSDLGQGEIIRNESEGSIYGSYGLVNIHAYNSYTGNNQPRWSVEVAESSAYDTKDEDWKILGTFEVRDSLDQ